MLSDSEPCYHPKQGRTAHHWCSRCNEKYPTSTFLAQGRPRLALRSLSVPCIISFPLWRRVQHPVLQNFVLHRACADNPSTGLLLQKCDRHLLARGELSLSPALVGPTCSPFPFVNQRPVAWVALTDHRRLAMQRIVMSIKPIQHLPRIDRSLLNGAQPIRRLGGILALRLTRGHRSG